MVAKPSATLVFLLGLLASHGKSLYGVGNALCTQTAMQALLQLPV